MRAKIELSDDPAAAADRGAHIVLTGGQVSRSAYERAAAVEADWVRATPWWGDECCVPPDDERSDYGMRDR